MFLLGRGASILAFHAEHLGRPLPELSRPHGVDPITHGNNGVEVEEINTTRDFTFPLGLNYPEFPDSCFLSDFSLLVDVFKVFINGSYIHIEQGRHQLLRQPNGFILVAHLDAIPTALHAKNQKFRRGITDI